MEYKKNAKTNMLGMEELLINWKNKKQNETTKEKDDFIKKRK